MKWPREIFQNGGQYNTYKHEMKIETEISRYMSNEYEFSYSKNMTNFEAFH